MKRAMLRDCGSVVAPVARTLPAFDPTPPALVSAPAPKVIAPPRPPGPPSVGVSVGALFGRAFLPTPRRGVPGPQADLVAGLTFEAWGLFRVGDRVELQPGMALFAAMHLVSTGLLGMALGGRVRVGWNDRLVSGVGGYAGLGRFSSLSSAGPFGPAGWDADAIIAHLCVTLLGVRVSPAVRLVLDAGLTGWLRAIATTPSAELATWGRFSVELVF